MRNILLINYDIPIWQIAVFIIGWVITIAWALIKLYFSDKNQSVINEQVSKKFIKMEDDAKDKLKTTSDTLEQKLKDYKEETKEKFSKIESDMSEIKADQKQANRSLTKIEGYMEMVLLKSMKKGNNGN